MTTNKAVRVATAIPLGISAIFFLIFVPSAHVSMWMACAVGYSLGLPVDRYENTINKVVSFFSGGILFYTVYAGTTLLFIEWLTREGGMDRGLVFTDPAWIYHTLINIALLVMFFTRKDRIPFILAGMEFFLITAPVMIGIQAIFGRELWGDVSRIIIYVVAGITLLIVHRLVALNTSLYLKILPTVRKLIIISLVIYTILLLLIVPLNLMLKGESEMERGNVRGISTWSLVD
jgi:hypothetical protein